MKEINVKQTIRLHAGVKYYPRYGVTSIVTDTVSRGTVHDPPYFSYFRGTHFEKIVHPMDRGKTKAK